MKKVFTSILLLAALSVPAYLSASAWLEGEPEPEGGEVEESPKDITDQYLTNADLSVENSGWTYYSDTYKYGAWRIGDETKSSSIEFYAGWGSLEHTNFKLSQTITLPAGDYRIAVNAFYREGNGGDGTNNNKAWIFAGETKQNVAALLGMSAVSQYDAGGDDMDDAMHAFAQGAFSNAFDFSLAEETEIELGFEGCFDSMRSWCILGPVKLYQYSLEDYLKDYRIKVAEAQAIEGKIGATEAAALSASIKDENEFTLGTEVAAAIRAIEDAIAAANISKSNYAALGALIAKGESYKANSSDEGAKAAYELAISDVTDAYNNATVEDFAAANATVSEALPALAKTQTAPNSDLSVFIVNPEINGSNGWQIETTVGGGGPLKPSGDALEFWAGSANPRNEAQFDIYQEISGLPNGLYTISADLFNSLNDEAGAVFAATAGVYGASGEAEAIKLIDVEGDQPNTYTTDAVIVTNGTLRIGFKSIAPMAARWVVADNFKLTLVNPIADNDLNYYNALAAIKDGEGYRIFTEINDTKYYLNTEGKLTDADNAATFIFNKVEVANTLYQIGWNLGAKFTNPQLTNGSSGDVVNNGKIEVGGNDRNDWERQVMFLNDEGKFAVRATNANSANWGANTYWDVVTNDELPAAGYSLEPSYVWQIAGYVDLTELNTLADKLQAQIAATETYDDPEEVAVTINSQIETIKNKDFTSKKEVDAAIGQIAELAKSFFNRIKAKSSIDVTDWYIVNPAPMNKKGWEGTDFGTASDGVCEYWNKSGADFHQAIEIPAGVYKLTAIALTRTGMDGKIYAGENSVGIATVANSVVNNRAQAAAWFAAGNGVNEVFFQMEEAGPITIGLTADNANGDHWTVWKNFKLEMIADIPVDVVYNLVNGENILATETITQLPGDEVKIPGAFANATHGLFALTADVEAITKETTVVNVTATWAGPFEFSTDIENAKWYTMDIRGGWQVSKCETEPYTMKQNATEEELATPEFQWAFLPVANDPYKVIIVNKASEGQSLTPADVPEGEGTRHAVVLRDGDYAWDIFANADGFVLREVGTENGWVNQAGGGSATSPLAFWDNAAGKTDGGSTFRVSEVPEASAGQVYAGIIEQTQYGPDGSVIATTTTEQTVTITEVTEGIVNITFSGFTLPMAALGSFNEFTVENVVANTQMIPGYTVYVSDAFQVGVQMGQMAVNYNGELYGAVGPEQTAPVLKLILQNATKDVAYFGANEEDINRFKAQEPKEALKTYDLTANDVEVSDWSTITIADATIISEAATLLGAQPSELIYQLVDTTGVRKDYNGNEGEVLFWVDYNGNKSDWGVNNKYYISYDAETPAITVTQFGAEYSKTLNAVVRLENADGDFVEFKINVTMEDVPVINPEIVKTIEIEGFDLAETAYNADENHLPTFDVAEVCTALGIDNISNAETYIVNVTTGEFVKNTTDGWRNADGDATAWGQATNGYCLKLNNPASGQFDYSGAHDANFAVGDTYLAQWAIVAGEKAVLLKVTIKFLSQDDYSKATGINGIAADVENGKVFNIAGQKTGRVQKGVNIIGGKKVYVK